MDSIAFVETIQFGIQGRSEHRLLVANSAGEEWWPWSNEKYQNIHLLMGKSSIKIYKMGILNGFLFVYQSLLFFCSILRGEPIVAGFSHVFPAAENFPLIFG